MSYQPPTTTTPEWNRDRKLSSIVYVISGCCKNCQRSRELWNISSYGTQPLCIKYARQGGRKWKRDKIVGRKRNLVILWICIGKWNRKDVRKIRERKEVKSHLFTTYSASLSCTYVGGMVVQTSRPFAY